jgi:protein SHQ1
MLRLPRKECNCLPISFFQKNKQLSERVFSHNKDLASPEETHNLYLTLLTLLFAHAYDARTTQHDPTPESAWTIAALTPAFSALDPPPYSSPQQSARGGVDVDVDFDSGELAETLVPSFRRALAFPLYRSWALADACRADVAQFLLRGTRTVLRCLLELRAILDTHEVYYVYSRIWLDDFCRWIQACARYVVARRLCQIDL